MRVSFFIAASVISVVLPTTALAMQTQTLDFAAGQVNATWEGLGPIQMTQQPSGIILKSTGTGLFVTAEKLKFLPEEAIITTSAEKTAHIFFIWTYANDPEQISHSLAITLPAGQIIRTNFSLFDIPSFGTAEKKIGLYLPQGTTMLLHKIEFAEWNIFEKVVEAIRSFWVFDAYSPYSINFIWGPQLAFNPVERANLFVVNPPTSLSAMVVIYGGLIILFTVFAAYAYYSMKAERKRRTLLLGIFLSGAVWCVLDIRMGSEFLQWISHDRSSYIAAPETTRTFRERDRFYDFAAFVKPLVSDRTTYIFFAEQEWPYLGNMRYLTYPSIPGIDTESDDTWVIYNRADLSVDAAGQIVADGLPVSLQGHILGRFDEHSFVFRTDEKPTPTPPPSR